MIRDKLIKVCGMRVADNIRDVSRLSPDFMGFIFWGKSPRAATGMSVNNMSCLSPATQPVGVFVNESIETIHSICDTYGISTVQLHGTESPEMCRELRSDGLHVWKAYGVDADTDFSVLEKYEDAVDMFVFDTKTPKCGGSGVRFDWSVLDRYHLDIPYMLSGGIGPDSTDDILAAFHRPHLAGIDINSRFESSPGIKDTEKITNFVTSLKK